VRLYCRAESLSLATRALNWSIVASLGQDVDLLSFFSVKQRGRRHRPSSPSFAVLPHGGGNTGFSAGGVGSHPGLVFFSSYAVHQPAIPLFDSGLLVYSPLASKHTRLFLPAAGGPDPTLSFFFFFFFWVRVSRMTAPSF